MKEYEIEIEELERVREEKKERMKKLEEDIR